VQTTQTEHGWISPLILPTTVSSVSSNFAADIRKPLMKEEIMEEQAWASLETRLGINLKTYLTNYLIIGNLPLG